MSRWNISSGVDRLVDGEGTGQGNAVGGLPIVLSSSIHPIP